MVTITLPNDLEAWAREQVATGRASTIDALIAEALREHRHTFASHKALLVEAYGQLARGELVSEQELDAELDSWIAEDRAACR